MWGVVHMFASLMVKLSNPKQKMVETASLSLSLFFFLLFKTCKWVISTYFVLFSRALSVWHNSEVWTINFACNRGLPTVLFGLPRNDLLYSLGLKVFGGQKSVLELVQSILTSFSLHWVKITSGFHIFHIITTNESGLEEDTIQKTKVTKFMYIYLQCPSLKE